MESIYIENFGGIKEMSLDINQVNILIGPQASGKSVTAKLIYYFKLFPSTILRAVERSESKRELDGNQKDNFLKYFPKTSWPEEDFRIKYTNNQTYIEIQGAKHSTIKISYSDNYKKLLTNGKRILQDEWEDAGNGFKTNFALYPRSFNLFHDQIENLIDNSASFTQIFIPSGRSFFSNVQSTIFTLLSNDNAIDPFLIEFGSFYESYKRIRSADLQTVYRKSSKIDKLVDDILKGTYHKENDIEFIKHKDGRKVNLANASSGQQETFPLLFILKMLNILYSKPGITLYIEEPEAHLFPSSQRKIVQILARTFNNPKSNFQLIITTHSPYILSSFNNLMEAGKIASEQPEKSYAIEKVIPKEEWLLPSDVNASSIFSGKIKTLIDPETKLISQNSLDSVSDDLAIDFGKLLDIEF